MANTRGDLNVDIGARLDKFERALRDVQGEFKKLSGNIQSRSKTTSNSMENAFVGSLKKISSAMAAAFSVQQIAQFATEAVNLAAKAEGIEIAFKRIGGQNILGDLREATKGTVSDLQLMQATVQANNFQIPIQNLASLFEFARRRAKETGESVDYLVNSIVLGIGRKSPLILDNLGISAVRLREELKGAGVEAATVGQIAEIIGGIAQEEMSKMGDEAATTKDKIDRLSASFKNFQVKAGEKIIDSGGGSFLEGLTKFVDALSRGMELGEIFKFDELAHYDKIFELMSTDLSNHFKNLKKDTDEYENALVQVKVALFRAEFELMKYKKTAHQNGIKTAELLAKKNALAKFLEQLTQANKKNTGETNKSTAANIAQSNSLKELAAAQNELIDSMTRGFRPTEVNERFFGEGFELDDIVGGDLEDFENLDKEAQAFFQNMTAQAQMANSVINVLGGSINRAFLQGIENGLNFGDALKKMFQDLAKQMAAALVTAVALKAVLSALGLGSAISIGSLFARQFGVGGVGTLAQGASVGGGLNISGFNRIAGTQLVTTYKLGSQDASRWNNTAG